MKLRLSDPARQDLEDIYAFSLDRFGEAQALRYFDRLISQLEQLVQFPRSGRHSRLLSAQTRMLKMQSHFAAYQIRDDEILILRILHERQLPSGI